MRTKVDASCVAISFDLERFQLPRMENQFYSTIPENLVFILSTKLIHGMYTAIFGVKMMGIVAA